MNEIKDLVRIDSSKNDEIFCDSRMVSEKFGKRHDNVLQRINQLVVECRELDANLSPENQEDKNPAVEIFIEKVDSYKNRELKYYEMNKPAFSLLAMGFTGKEALYWKRQFNTAFYLMEQKIRTGELELERREKRYIANLKKHNKEAKKLEDERIYLEEKKMIISPFENEKQLILKWLKKKNKTVFTKRDLVRSMRNLFKTNKTLERPLRSLEDDGKIKCDKANANDGRIACKYIVIKNLFKV